MAYKVIGKITREDFAVLITDAQVIVHQESLFLAETPLAQSLGVDLNQGE